MFRVKPDKQKAIALMKMVEITLNRLNESNKEKYPTNTLTDYYDILHKIMEALTSLEGLKFKGEGAHRRLIDYVCHKYRLGEGVRNIIQELRDYRNRVNYEGFMIKEDYVKRNSEKIEKIIEKLKGIINKIL